MAFRENSEIDIKPEPKPGPFGRFYLQELINSGGMADIWLATDPQSKPYALRKLHDRLRFSLISRKRFLRGCDILSKIHDHEYVIQYIEHGKISGALYCLMEYIEGSNLKQLFSRGDPILQDHVGNILIDMAVALEHVHDSGFMHLDFKPENVLVTRNANVRLVDFDLALPKPEKPIKSSKNPGTPAYMSPEQLRRGPLNTPAGNFSFWAGAFEFFRGAKTFFCDKTNEIFSNQPTRTA